MLLNKDEVLQFIPQRPPMVMVAGLLSNSSKQTKSYFKIESNNLFLKENRFQPAGLIENMAQTVALHAGYQFASSAPSLEKETPIPIGFIGEVKNFEYSFLPQVEDEIFTEIEVLHEIFTTFIVKGNVFYQNKLIASCEMKVFQQA